MFKILGFIKYFILGWNFLLKSVQFTVLVTFQVTWFQSGFANGEWSALSSVLWVFGWFSLDFLFKVSNFMNKITCTACIIFIVVFFLWLWPVLSYDEIVPCSVTSDMTPFSSWMPITEFFNIFFVSAPWKDCSC